MATQCYRLTTTSRSAGAGTVRETVTITAENDDEAIELARDFVKAVAAEAFGSAILTDASGTIIWRERNWDQWGGEPDRSPQDGGSA